MKNKITVLLNVNIITIVAVIIIIACCDTKNFVDKFLPGITSIFLVQMIVVYHGDFEKALIVSEWYLSPMIICMLIMVPIFLLFKKNDEWYLYSINITWSFSYFCNNIWPSNKLEFEKKEDF